MGRRSRARRDLDCLDSLTHRRRTVHVSWVISHACRRCAPSGFRVGDHKRDVGGVPSLGLLHAATDHGSPSTLGNPHWLLRCLLTRPTYNLSFTSTAFNINHSIPFVPTAFAKHFGRAFLRLSTASNNRHVMTFYNTRIHTTSVRNLAPRIPSSFITRLFELSRHHILILIMAKRLPDMRRDSMFSRLSGGSSSRGSPLQCSPLVQPQQHRSNMAGDQSPTQSFMEQTGHMPTPEQVQQHYRRIAVNAMLAQMTPNQRQGLLQQQQERTLAQPPPISASPTQAFVGQNGQRTAAIQGWLAQMSPLQRQRAQQQVQESVRSQQPTLAAIPMSVYALDKSGRHYMREEFEACTAAMSPGQRQRALQQMAEQQQQQRREAIAASPPQTLMARNSRMLTREEVQEYHRQKVAAQAQAYSQAQKPSQQQQDPQQPTVAGFPMESFIKREGRMSTQKDTADYVRQKAVLEAQAREQPHMSPEQRQQHPTTAASPMQTFADRFAEQYGRMPNLEEAQECFKREADRRANTQVQISSQRRQQSQQLSIAMGPMQTSVDRNGRTPTREEAQEYQQLQSAMQANTEAQMPSQQRQQSRQPSIVTNPLQTRADQNGHTLTRKETPALHRRMTVMMPQISPEQMQQLRQQHQQKTGQISYLSGSPPMDLQALHQPTHPRIPSGPVSSWQMIPNQTINSGINAYPLAHSPHRSSADGYQLTARDMQDMARASGVQGSYHVRETPSDPRLTALSSAQCIHHPFSPPPLPSQSTRPTPAQRMSTPASRPSSASSLPQMVGTKRPLPGGQNAYAEGPSPKMAMYSTAPLSRPSSAQDKVRAEPKKTEPKKKAAPKAVPKAAPKAGPAHRLNKEALKRGVHSLNVSKEKSNVDADVSELRKPGHATAASPGYAKEMMDIKKKGAKKGATASMGVPTRPASAMGQTKTKTPEVIDLTMTGTDEPQGQKIYQRAATPQFPASTNPFSPRISTHVDAVVHRLNLHALGNGVNMADVEYGPYIKDSMKGWLAHEQDIRNERSMLDPSLDSIKRLAKSTFENTSSNMMGSAHAEALKPPTNFSMQPVLTKVRDPKYYGFAYSGNNGGVLPDMGQDVLAVCTMDEAEFLRAPATAGMTEEGAQLEYGLCMLAKENVGRFVGDEIGQATWR
ncbi:hypothetical protein EJ02DRAFT_46440 [Clathrospora elynae]|uniref:Uncharacterized protein n=1 Tax=Clathrospora elynae TaxID=706981 RepID=A0A6A5SZW0_9PLEO|nr:hypothetical protein EJ02DRAFT_46440 [Clathrospora elynae]